MNDARIGWSHITLNSGNRWASGVGQFGNTLGIGNGNPGSLPGLLALNFSNSNVSNIGAAEQTQSFDDHVWQIEDGVSWNHGRHNFKFGGQWWRQIIKTFYAGNNGRTGTDGLQRTVHRGPQVLRLLRETVAADFFLGLDYQYGRGVSTGQDLAATSNVIGFYAQDTWRSHRSLNLESWAALRCAFALGRSQQPASELQLHYRQYRSRWPERGQPGSLRRNLWRQGFPAAHRFRMDSLRYWATTR